MSGSGQTYSDSDLMSALRAADAAGDSAGAARLAQMIQGRQSGATPSEVSAVPQQDTFAPTRYAKMGAGAALQGFEQLLGLPGTLQNLGNAATAKFQGLLGYSPEMIQRFRDASSFGNFPSGNQIVGVSNALGLTNRPDVVPMNTPERIFTGAMEGAGAGGPFGVVPALVGGISGAASEGAHELWPESKVAPVAAGMATGFLGGGAVNAVENVLTGRALNRAVTTAEGNLSSAQSARAAVPGQLSGLANSISPTIQTIQDAGSNLLAAAKRWAFGDPANGVKSTMQTKLDNAWAPVTQLVGNDAPVVMDNFRQAVKDATTSAGRLEPVAKIFRSGEPDKTQSALQAVEEFAQMSGTGPMTWEEASRLRTMIGDARGNPDVVKTIGQENLNKMYAALSNDLKAAAKAKGPDALKAFNDANVESSRLYSIAKDQVQPILDSNPEDAAAKLLAGAKRGGTDLAILRGEMPDAINALSAAHLRVMGKDWEKLSPEGKLALAGDPSIVQQADAIMASGSKANVTSAKEALAQAKQTVKDRAKAAQRSTALEGLYGAGIGYDLGVLGLNALGYSGHDILGGATGSLIGALGLRPITAMTRGYVQNPSSLQYPALGALGGLATSNQLTASQLSAR